MVRFGIEKVLQGFLSLFIASVLIFSLLLIFKGDLATVRLGLGATEESLEKLRTELGLNLPVMTRYWDWVQQFLLLKNPKILSTGAPVLPFLWESLFFTVRQIGLVLLVSSLIAIPCGLIAGAFPRSLVGRLIRGYALFSLSLPSFWIASLLLLFFSYRLGLFPPIGYQGLSSLILPTLALSIPQSAVLIRTLKGRLDSVLREPYIRTALGKGLSVSSVLFHHAFPLCWRAFVTILGLQFTALLAGTLVVEQIFSLPGLGRNLFQAFEQRDLFLAADFIFIIVALSICVSLIVDFLVLLVDPRVKV